jgi:hypothetical protein
VLNVKRVPKERPDEERPRKLTKLEILADEPESERFDFITNVKCYECGDIPPTAGNVSLI